MSVPVAKSWDHSLRELAERDRTVAGHRMLCQHPRCCDPATFVSYYRFVASKRTTKIGARYRRLCSEHAHAFAKAHELELETS